MPDRTTTRRVLVGALTALVLTHGVSAPAQETSRGTVTLRGAGATFPSPLYERWIAVFRRDHPDVLITYDAVGSGEGQRRFLDGTVDFGASDAALSDEQIGRARAGARLVPVTAGMVVLAYNLPGLDGTLKLSREVYTDIFSGRIRSWNDPRVRAINPTLKLPNHTIALVARHDRSGTTYALTNHLAALGGSWTAEGQGVGQLVDWKGRAMLAKGNEGVAGRIKGSADAIGYVEYHFAKRLGLAVAALENRAGRYVEPSDAGGQAAIAAHTGVMPANLRLFMPDPPGSDSYPIVSFSWLLLQDRYTDPRKAAALRTFVSWGLTAGQALSRDLGYVALPPDVVSLSLAAVDRVN